jgi:SPX domain protein involved in polyphosphate accumulation
VQYFNYEELKQQIDLLGQYLEASSATTSSESLFWLKLLFQHTIDSEISKVLGFYEQQHQQLMRTVELLSTREKALCLACLNVRTPQYAPARRHERRFALPPTLRLNCADAPPAAHFPRLPL